MSNGNEFSVGRTDDDLMELWRGNGPAAPDAERVAREIMARVWRFDQQILWRNFREYAAGLVLMVIFAVQMVLGSDRAGGAIGFVCVAFVMAYLWWRHRGLEPLDPAADLAAYRRALILRFDDQIRLLRTTPYWYLLPLFLPGVWLAISEWDHLGWKVLVPLGVVALVFVFIGWLNVKVGVGGLRQARDRVAAVGMEE